jgi:hypothetical protein
VRFPGVLGQRLAVERMQLGGRHRRVVGDVERDAAVALVVDHLQPLVGRPAQRLRQVRVALSLDDASRRIRLIMSRQMNSG